MPYVHLLLTVIRAKLATFQLQRGLVKHAELIALSVKMEQSVLIVDKDFILILQMETV